MRITGPIARFSIPKFCFSFILRPPFNRLIHPHRLFPFRLGTQVLNHIVTDIDVWYLPKQKGRRTTIYTQQKSLVILSKRQKAFRLLYQRYRNPKMGKLHSPTNTDFCKSLIIRYGSANAKNTALTFDSQRNNYKQQLRPCRQSYKYQHVQHKRYLHILSP